MTPIASPSNLKILMTNTYKMINQLNYMYMYKLCSTREAGTSITVSENGTYKYLLLQYAKWSTEAGTFRSVVFVNPVHRWLVAALSILMISMFY